MRNNYLAISLLSLTLGLATPKATAANMIEIIEQEQLVSVYASGTTLHVIGANGQTMELYNVAGMKIKSIQIDGAERHFTMNLSRGCYIVKIGNVVRKISIR